MITYKQIWKSIDHIAYTHGMLPSELSELCGLGPNAFDKNMRKRWPSLKTISIICETLGVEFKIYLK